MNFENLDNLRPVRKYKFKGWDWSEIGHALGYTTPDTEEGEAKLLSWIHNIISEEMEAPFYGRKRGVVTKVVRKFVATLGRIEFAAEAPLWRGLGEISDDWTFLKYADALLESMWT